MNTGLLDQIDRAQHKIHAKKCLAYSPLKTRNIFLISLFTTPFSVVEFMFVPMLGQLLVLLLLAAALYYFKLERFPKYFLAAISGILLSILLIVLISPHLHMSVIFVLYGILAFSTLLHMILIGWVGAQILRRFEKI